MEELSKTAPIGARIVQIAKIHRRWVAAELKKLGLYVGQELLLMRLCRSEGLRQSTLAEGLGIEPPTVHRMLARLGAAGFVERRPDPNDARASLTYLTPRGRETGAPIREIWRGADERPHGALPPAHPAQLARAPHP